jgi:hypothetical protein
MSPRARLTGTAERGELEALWSFGSELILELTNDPVAAIVSRCCARPMLRAYLKRVGGDHPRHYV